MRRLSYLSLEDRFSLSSCRRSRGGRALGLVRARGFFEMARALPHRHFGGVVAELVAHGGIEPFQLLLALFERVFERNVRRQTRARAGGLSIDGLLEACNRLAEPVEKVCGHVVFDETRLERQSGGGERARGVEKRLIVDVGARPAKAVFHFRVVESDGVGGIADSRQTALDDGAGVFTRARALFACALVGGACGVVRGGGGNGSLEACESLPAFARDGEVSGHRLARARRSRQAFKASSLFVIHIDVSRAVKGRRDDFPSGEFEGRARETPFRGRELYSFPEFSPQNL